MPARITTFGRKTNIIEKRDFEGLVSQLADKPNQSVFFCNVHMLMLSEEDQALANAMDSADWVFADGVPVAWLQRRISGKNAKVIRGYEIMLAVCERASRSGEKVGFIGSTSEVMKQLVATLSTRFEGLTIAYQYCPPFVAGELLSIQADIKAIKDSNIAWLFVGLGCPKQELWIARYQNELDCHLLGVGAAFEWLSGVSKKPPSWMEQYALAWFFRLVTSPSKTWRRYLKYNTKFIFKAFRRLLRSDKPVI